MCKKEGKDHMNIWSYELSYLINNRKKIWVSDLELFWTLGLIGVPNLYKNNAIQLFSGLLRHR